MRFKTLAGKERFLNIESTRIDWYKPSLSKFQKGVKDFLYPYWKNHIVYEEMPVLGTRLRIDFYNASKRIAVECNGRQHGNYNKFFHQGCRENYRLQIERDLKKYQWCEINGIELIEIEPDDKLSSELFERFGIKL